MGVGAIIRERREQLRMTQDVLAGKVGISKPYLSNIETGRAKNPPTDGILVALESALAFDRGQLLKLAHLERTPPDVLQDHEMLEAELQRLRSVLKEFMSGSRKPNGSLDLEELASRVKAVPTDMDMPPSDEMEPPAEHNLGTIQAGAVVPIINNVAAGYPRHFTDLDYPPSVADEYLRCPDLHDSQAFAARVVGDSMEPKYHQGDVVVFSPNAPVRNGDDCFVRFEADSSTTFKRFYQDNDTTIRLQPLNSLYPAQTYDRQQVSGLWPAVFRFEKLR